MRDRKKKENFREAQRRVSLAVTAAHYQPTPIQVVCVRSGPGGLTDWFRNNGGHERCGGETICEDVDWGGHCWWSLVVVVPCTIIYWIKTSYLSKNLLRMVEWREGDRKEVCWFLDSLFRSFLDSVESDVHMSQAATGNNVWFVNQTAGVNEFYSVKCAWAQVTLVTSRVLSQSQ